MIKPHPGTAILSLMVLAGVISFQAGAQRSERIAHKNAGAVGLNPASGTQADVDQETAIPTVTLPGSIEASDPTVGLEFETFRDQPNSKPKLTLGSDPIELYAGPSGAVYRQPRYAAFGGLFQPGAVSITFAGIGCCLIGLRQRRERDCETH